MNKISYREIKNRNSNKLALKASYKDNKLQKELKFNGFNIIELNEEEINPENDPDLNIFSDREIQRLKKKATAIEEYYSNKSEDTKINENCFNCLMSDFKPNELLYFNKRKDLLTYLKYCFYFLKKILFLDYQIYIENRYDLDKCDTNLYLNGWKFFIPKTMCRACFLQIINMEHLFGNLKTIFSDIDPNSISRNIHRNRSHINPRVRIAHSVHRNINIKSNDKNENESESKNKIIIPKKENKIKIKNSKYHSKSNHNISYDDKNGLLSIKKDILGEVGNLVKRKDENEKKSKIHKNQNSEFNNEINNPIDEQSVTEIKIKANEFIGEGNLLENNNGENKLNKKNLNKNEFHSKDENKNNKNHQNKNIGNNNKESNTNNNGNNTSLNDNTLNNSNKINNELKIKEEKSNSSSNKNKKTMNIYNEILNVKHMTNKIVIKLNLKLISFKDILTYTIMNIGDFKEKLYNSISYNPDIIPYGINQYEQYFYSLYNEGFKAKKEYEEMFTKIKTDSIPSISRNILKLKEQEKLLDEEKKNLDELEKNLKEYSEEIDEMENRYLESMNNFFRNFVCFLKLIKELKNDYGGPIY